jgi:hypothetical protein
MAKDAKTRARAKALYEAGKSFSQIADELPVSDRAAKEWCRREGWVKGKSSQELHQTEREALHREAEKAGIDKAKWVKELALLGFSDMADYVDIHDETGATRVRGWDEMNGKNPGASRVVKKIREKRTIRQSNDKSGDILVDQTFEFELHDKLGALRTIGDAMGWSQQAAASDNIAESIMAWVRSEK